MTTHQQCYRLGNHDPHNYPANDPKHYCRGRKISQLRDVPVKHIRVCDTRRPHMVHAFEFKDALKVCPGWEYAGPRPPEPAKPETLTSSSGVEMAPTVEDQGDFWLVKLNGRDWIVPKSAPNPDWDPAWSIKPGQLPPPPEPIISPKQVRQLMGFLREIARDVNYLADQKGKEIESGQ